jgi:photosystem II stability/assembly factor-like uncharacterized protein
MRNLLFYAGILLVMSSCSSKLDEQIIFYAELSKCEAEKPLTVPKGFKINELGTINIDNAVLDFQFFDNKLGYALASQNFGGFVNIFKTEDGGIHWKNLNIKINQIPVSFHFVDQHNGLITVHDVTGCPDKCQNICVIFTTKDGGKTWERREIENLKGSLYYVTSDTQQNLYATLFVFNQKPIVVKSKDKGITWDTLFISDNMRMSSIKFGLKLFNDNLYIHAKHGDILKISTKGELLKTIKTNQMDIHNLEVVSNDTLVIKGNTGLHKSNDEGKSWVAIEKNWGEIVEFVSGQEGMVIKHINSCPTDVLSTNDAFSFTKDGGVTWENGSEFRNLLPNYVTCQIVDNKYYIFLNTKFLVLEKR